MCARELDVAGEVLRRQRLLEPREAERLERARAPDGLRHAEALVRVDHDLERIADRFAHRRESRDVLGETRLADLELGAAKALRLRVQRLRDQRFRRQVKPPAFGRVDGHLGLRAAGRLPQRQCRPLAAQIPQRGVDRGERKARDRADGRRVRVEEEILPDRLDAIGIAADRASAPDGRAAAPRPTSRRSRSCSV